MEKDPPDRYNHLAPSLSTLGHTKYMGLGSLIHFVWGFLSYILYGDCFNSWSSKGPLSTPLI